MHKQVSTFPILTTDPCCGEATCLWITAVDRSARSELRCGRRRAARLAYRDAQTGVHLPDLNNRPLLRRGNMPVDYCCGPLCAKRTAVRPTPSGAACV